MEQEETDNTFAPDLSSPANPTEQDTPVSEKNNLLPVVAVVVVVLGVGAFIFIKRRR